METPEQLTEAKAGDHFIVEELLDFSSIEDELGLDAASGSNSSSDSSSLTVAAAAAGDSYGNSLSAGEPNFSGDIISGDPYEELAELEWLSNFVEESFSSEDMETMQLISGAKAGASQTRGGSGSDISSAAAPGGGGGGGSGSDHIFLPEAPVPGKARSKRPRAAPCNWSSRLLALSPGPELSEPDVFGPGLSAPAKKAPKMVKKKEGQPGAAGAAGAAPAADGRRCLHCATDKTPQWRTGPMGPKTLCNACGVRYKSGRLVPEYRPAASPTFMLSKHSNSHRKVLELRRQREMQHHQFAHHHGGGAAAAFDGDGFLIHHHIGPDFRQLI